MIFFVLKPQVDGHFGRNSVFIDESARPPKIEKLHFVLDSFSGDDIITTIGTYVVTKRLADLLKTAKPSITGIAFDQVEISKSDEYYWSQKEGFSYAPKQLPEFVWLKIDGKPGVDDFAKPGSYGLVVSERALNILKSLNLQLCDIEDFDPSLLPT